MLAAVPTANEIGGRPVQRFIDPLTKFVRPHSHIPHTAEKGTGLRPVPEQAGHRPSIS